jgi:hypothetical protein
MRIGCVHPPAFHRKETNTEFEIGKRVILSWAIERKFDGGFDVNSYRKQILRAVQPRHTGALGSDDP